MRSAGSHGFADILAISFFEPIIRIIQVKSGSYEDKGKRLEELRNLEVSDIFSKELWHYERGKWEITKL